MRPEPISADDSDENRTLIQDPELLYESELSTSAQRRSFVPSARPSTQPRERESNLPGAILARRYRLEQVVERSATEMVLIARHLELGEPVVMRRLTPEGAASPDLVASFLSGARQALQLKSFHVERVTDLGRLESGAPYRVSELPRGPSLEEFVQVRGALPAEDAVDLVLRACEGMAEAHSRGITHRNLSTANIVLERHPDGAPLIRIRNFGLPDLLDGETQLGARLRHQPVHRSNALRYASPEQIRDPEIVDQRSDIWALGAILYELLAGVPAYSARSSSALLAMIVADPPLSLDQHRDDLQPELEAAVLACLAKNPEDRPRSVDELVRLLLPFASEQVDGVATRVTRVLVGNGGARASFGTYAAQRARSGIPALPARTLGPYYGSGAPPRYSQRDYYDPPHASQRQSRPQRSELSAPPPTNTPRSVLLLVAGAALGGVVTFMLTTIGLRLQGMVDAKPVAAAVPTTPEPPKAPLVAPPPLVAPTVVAAPAPRPKSDARRVAQRERKAKDSAPEPEAATRAADSAAPTGASDEALFDRPE